MSACTFFGHRDIPDSVKPALYESLENVIRQGVDLFYVGNHGRFDTMVLHALQKMKEQYPHIDYAVVLAYLPKEQPDYPIIWPDGLENVLPRYAVSRRNDWMIRQSDFIIACVERSWGGAAHAVFAAERQKKTVIHLIRSDQVLLRKTPEPNKTNP